jgi:hypothetical protein
LANPDNGAELRMQIAAHQQRASDALTRAKLALANEQFEDVAVAHGVALEALRAATAAMRDVHDTMTPMFHRHNQGAASVIEAAALNFHPRVESAG